MTVYQDHRDYADTHPPDRTETRRMGGLDLTFKYWTVPYQALIVSRERGQVTIKTKT